MLCNARGTRGVTITIWLKDHSQRLTKRVPVTRVRRGMACSILAARCNIIRGKLSGQPRAKGLKLCNSSYLRKGDRLCRPSRPASDPCFLTSLASGSGAVRASRPGLAAGTSRPQGPSAESGIRKSPGRHGSRGRTWHQPTTVSGDCRQGWGKGVPHGGNP